MFMLCNAAQQLLQCLWCSFVVLLTFMLTTHQMIKLIKFIWSSIRTHHDDGCNISDSEIWKENKMMIIYHQEWAQDMQLQPNNYEFFCSCRWILFQLMLFIFTELAISEHKSDIYCNFYLTESKININTKYLVWYFRRCLWVCF